MNGASDLGRVDVLRIILNGDMDVVDVLSIILNLAAICESYTLDVLRIIPRERQYQVFGRFADHSQFEYALIGYEWTFCGSFSMDGDRK